MKQTINKILKEYLEIYPKEEERQKMFSIYLEDTDSQSLIDWNNFDGHIVSSGFIYAKEEKKFLVLYHKDLAKYLYPGGHINKTDKNILQASKREIQEETSLSNISLLKVSDNDLVPFDIDTHLIPFNERLGLPEHYHFDFRYLFTVEKISNIELDENESSSYKWISLRELEEDKNYEQIISKIKKQLNNKN